MNTRNPAVRVRSTWTTRTRGRRTSIWQRSSAAAGGSAIAADSPSLVRCWPLSWRPEAWSRARVASTHRGRSRAGPGPEAAPERSADRCSGGRRSLGERQADADVSSCTCALTTAAWATWRKPRRAWRRSAPPARVLPRGSNAQRGLGLKCRAAEASPSARWSLDKPCWLRLRLVPGVAGPRPRPARRQSGWSSTCIRPGRHQGQRRARAFITAGKFVGVFLAWITAPGHSFSSTDDTNEVAYDQSGHIIAHVSNPP